MNLDENAVQQVTDYFSLMRLLSEKLDWEINAEAAQDDVTFDWSGDELHLSESSARRLNGGVVRQLRLTTSNAPWGIFFVEFNERNVYRTVLRQVLRGLVPKRRRELNLPAWKHDNLLFICTTRDYRRFTFAHFRGQQENRAVLATFSWERGDTHVRTLCEFNLPALSWPDDPSDEESWLKQWRGAFDVEAVTDKFFKSYHSVFKDAEAEVRKSVPEPETARLYTQRLFNRLMFLYFIQKKEWLSFEGDKRYLRALFTKAEGGGQNFMRDRLYWVFFAGMSNVLESREAHGIDELRRFRGDVPYLNGGLFDMEDEFDERGGVVLPNKVFAAILDLFEQYNFTVTESTPLDVQVAVDPEMLGKVFEELVTGRHETGSYYTPRPIVSFMCREALKYYLIDSAGLSQHEAERFVDDAEAEELPNAERVLDVLKTVRVCDPACGSGAYLLGMMQELLRLRGALFKSKQLDSDSVYLRKRSIIENNLYGVDKDRFAVQIACLRLWLSLAIESDKPQTLPNLDFKIECGDSLTGPRPDTNDQQLEMSRSLLVGRYQAAKAEFLACENHERKRKLRDEIDELQQEITLALNHKPQPPSQHKLEVARQQLTNLKRQLREAEKEKNQAKAAGVAKKIQAIKKTLVEWESASEEYEPGFDWAVEFAEVFSTARGDGGRWDGTFSMMNEVARQPMFTDRQVTANGEGFDIVLANPPYVRMELFKAEKPVLRRNFPDVHSDRADLYVYFYDRAQQLLKDGGVGCFISSNKWLRAGYGENLRRHLLDEQAFHLVVDFGELPVFKAATFPAVFLWQKQAREERPTTWAVITSLQDCYEEGPREHILRLAHTVPASSFAPGSPRLASSTTTELRRRMERSGPRLEEFTAGQILYGAKSGLNEAFVISKDERDRLIREDDRSGEVIKALVVGDDIRSYEVHFRQRYLLYMFHGVDGSRYRAVKNYLAPFRARLERRATKQEWYELQQPQATYALSFEKPKIIYPDIGKEMRFVLDNKGYFINDTGFALPVGDWYLLAILNARSAFQYLKTVCAALGDEEKGGRLRFKTQYMRALPVPIAHTTERDAIALLAKKVQKLHVSRRGMVEKFLHKVGISPPQSNSRSPLEQVWQLTAIEFTRHVRNGDLKTFNDARDDTHTLTERIGSIEREINERVAALYGL
jgi:hypothetical protein